MPVRYLITTLKPGVDPAAYERWVREYDYRIARGRQNMIRYDVHRILHPLEGAENTGWNYIERIEVRSFEQSRLDAASESGIELRRQMYGEFIERSRNITFATTLIE